MTKKVFLMLVLAMAGIASVNAQMRIGGSEAPDKSAVLDLNPDNNTLSGNASLGLALPRINLRNSNDAFPLVSHVKGMTVYNMATAGDVKPGVYVSNGVKWLRQADSELDFAILGDSIVNYITQNFSTTALGDSISYYITHNFETLNLGDTIMQFITNNLDSSALMDSVANYISNNNAYLTQLIDNIAQNVYSTTLGDSIVNYISTQISNTLLGDTILQYITENITNTLLGDSIINIVHNNELDGIIGNEVTNATANGGLIRSGAGTANTPYTLGIASSGVKTDHIADNAVTSAKITDGTIANADISNSAAIALNKLALPDATANNGKVLKSNGTTWVAGVDNDTNSDTNTTYTAGNGLTLSGTTFNIGTGQINSSMITDGTIASADLSSMGASNGQVLKWNGTAWSPATDTGLTAETDGVVGNEVTNATTNGGLTRSGAGTAASPYTLGIITGGVTSSHIADNAITANKIVDGTITNADINASAAIDLTKIALPNATANNGKVLKSNGTAWIAGEDNNTVSNTTYSAGGGLTLSGTTFSIGAEQVNSTMIADGTISTVDIADNAVTSAKIVNKTITNDDIANSAIKPNLLNIDGDRGFVWFDREDNNNTFTDIEKLNSNHLANNAVTSEKIADNTIMNADINDYAGIRLNKLSSINSIAGNPGAEDGSVLTWGEGGWQPMPAAKITSVSGANGISVSDGTTAPVVSIADNGVTSAKIQNGTIKAEDLNSMGASEGNILTFTNNSWLPKPLNLDGAVVYLGTNDETYSPIPGGTYSAGQILSIFIKTDVPVGYSYYILIPYSTANAMFPAFATTFGSGVHSRHIMFTKSASYSSFNVRYLIFGIK